MGSEENIKSAQLRLSPVYKWLEIFKAALGTAGTAAILSESLLSTKFLGRVVGSEGSELLSGIVGLSAFIIGALVSRNFFEEDMSAHVRKD